MKSVSEALKTLNLEDFDSEYILPLDSIQMNPYSLLYVSLVPPTEDAGLIAFLDLYLQSFQERDPVTLMIYSWHTDEMISFVEQKLSAVSEPADVTLFGGEQRQYQKLSFQRSLLSSCQAILISETQLDFGPQLTMALALQRGVFFLGAAQQIPAVIKAGVYQSERVAELVPALQKACTAQLNGEVLADVREQIRQWQGLPPYEPLPRSDHLVLSALPKSASTYTARTLGLGLGALLGKGTRAPLMSLTPGAPFSVNILEPAKIKAFLQYPTSIIAYDHFIPSPYNRHFLEEYQLNRVIVTERDPRQALLSGLKARETLIQKKTARTETFGIPTGFDDWPLSKRVDHYIEAMLPKMVSFLNDWYRLEQEPQAKVKVRFNHFYDVKNDSEYFFSRILQFYGIPRSQFDFQAELDQPNKEDSIFANHPKLNSSHVHFRKGELNEWLDVFSPEQIERATAQIPEELLNYFNWYRP